MPVYKGSAKIGTVYRGGTKIEKVYRGSTLVYSGSEKTLTLKWFITSNININAFFAEMNYKAGQPSMMAGINYEFAGASAITSITGSTMSVSGFSYRNPFTIQIGDLPFVGWIRNQDRVPTGIAYAITSPKAQVGDLAINGNSMNVGFGWSPITITSDDGNTVKKSDNSTYNKSESTNKTIYLYRG